MSSEQQDQASAGETDLATASETMDRDRMDIRTFFVNFTQKSHATYLCYEVKEGGDLVPENQRMDFLKNQEKNQADPSVLSPQWPESSFSLSRKKNAGHAEVLFLKRVRSWNLDPEVPCRITCFISWSPCPDCARDLENFLLERPKVELDIHAAHIYDCCFGFKLGLQDLRAAGANISIMTRADYEHCWDTFVQNEGAPFNPRIIIDENINHETMRLENIFRESVVLPPQSPALPSEVTQDDKKDDPETLLTEETSKE